MEKKKYDKQWQTTATCIRMNGRRRERKNELDGKKNEKKKNFSIFWMNIVEKQVYIMVVCLSLFICGFSEKRSFWAYDRNQLRK